jgi:hypothetical protein
MEEINKGTGVRTTGWQRQNNVVVTAPKKGKKSAVSIFSASG